MPNPRRSSTSKVASASSRQSFPATINSSTKVTKDKLDTIMNRRKRQSKRRAADLDKENSSMNGAHHDKENSAMNILQSPTPYWKVAKERGNTTPPETRSTKKRKCTSERLDFSPSNENTAQPGLLIFSPPDQRENLRREKEKIARQEKDKDRRTNNARESGQLLIFSPTFRNPAPLPEALLERDESTGEPVPVNSGDIQDLVKDHADRIEKLSELNEELEQTIKTLQSDLQQLKADTENEKSEMVAKQEDLEQELAALQDKHNSEAKALAKEEKKLKRELQNTISDKNKLEGKIASCESDVNKLMKTLEESEEAWQTLHNKYSQEKKDLIRKCKEMEKSWKAEEKKNKDRKKSEAKLTDALKEYKAQLNEMENEILPESKRKLEEASKEIEDSRKATSASHEKIKDYESQISDLKDELAAVRDEQAEERKHFQALNEETSNAYEMITSNLTEKEEHIDGLKKELKEINHSLEAEMLSSSNWSKRVEQLQTETEETINKMKSSLAGKCLQLEQFETEEEVYKQRIAAMSLQLQSEKTSQNDILAQNDHASKQNEVLLQKLQNLQGELQAMKSERDAAARVASAMKTREHELFAKLQEGDLVRRALHNRVMQLSGSIRVYVRVRPALKSEESSKNKSGEFSPFSYPGFGGKREDTKLLHGADDLTKNLLEVVEPRKDRGGLSERRKKWTFGFDSVFNSEHKQEDVWEATEPLIQSAIDGFNVTIFAYGQTGSGKTFTMLGNEENPGLLSRAISKLFAAKDKTAELSRGKSEVDIAVELLEIYNEKVRDLLAARKNSKVDEKGLKIKANEAVGSTILPVSSEDQVTDILGRAQQLRCVKATSSNAESSRSHLLFTLHFTVSSDNGSSRTGKLHICDLAGSERLGKSNANAVVGSSLLKETKHINTSLSTLSNVIEKLQSGEANVPFRESKLTHLLQNSLGGNSKTLAIVCCNPLQQHFHESLCSLRFASKVNRVDLKAVANVQV